MSAPRTASLERTNSLCSSAAFAGVRLGYFAADPAIADAVRLVRLPYHLSAITQAAANAALEHSELMLSQVDRIRVQRDRMLEQIALLGYRPYPSEANFVLFGGVADPAAMFEEFERRGILIRNTGPADCLRVSAGTEAETSAFLTALAEITEARPELRLADSEGVRA